MPRLLDMKASRFTVVLAGGNVWCGGVVVCVWLCFDTGDDSTAAVSLAEGGWGFVPMWRITVHLKDRIRFRSLWDEREFPDKTVTIDLIDVKLFRLIKMN